MNIPTLISLVRGFLCLFFLSDSCFLRTFAIVLTAFTDFLDGYLARRWNQISPIGTKLDPLMDKLFVLAALSVFYSEQAVTLWQIVIFLLRDVSLLLFTFYLWINKQHRSWQIRSFFSGKIMTTLQFIALILLSQNIQVPFFLWGLLAFFGVASFFELLLLSKQKRGAA